MESDANPGRARRPPPRLSPPGGANISDWTPLSLSLYLSGGCSAAAAGFVVEPAPRANRLAGRPVESQ